MSDESANEETGGNKNHRKRPRTRADIEKERQERYQKTCQEIDEIVAEYHALLPRDAAKAVGAIYARYSTRFQGSIIDQVRAMLQEAVRRGIFVPREWVFFDLAVRGGKNDRQGLNRLRELLAQRLVQVLLLFATSRLFRKLQHTLAFVDQVVKEWGIRCIFVKSGIDSDDKQRWEMLLQMHGMIDQFSVAMHGEHVRAAHEGLFDKLQVYGTIPFGYTGEPIPGQLTKRNRPRRRIIIDPETAPWVKTIFRWYVEERLPIEVIVQQLNDNPDIPLSPKCTTGMWTYLAVHALLENPCYRGFWRYGAKENVWISSKDYSRQVERPEPLRQAQVEELRIVTDEVWYAAQNRLAEEKQNKAGRKPKDGDRKSRPRLLNGLFWCPEHDRPLQVGGAKGLAMICPCCRALPAATRPLYSFLNRVLALKLTCEALAQLIRQQTELVNDVIAACQAEAAALQQPDPQRLAELRAVVERLTRGITFNQRNVGVTPEEQEETARTIRELRTQRNAALTELRGLEGGPSRIIRVPNADDVQARIDNLGQVLIDAANGSEATCARAREVIRLLTGDRIDLYQQGERRPQQGWLQGRFRARLLSFLVNEVIGGGGAAATNNSPAIEVVIDYREPTLCECEADRAKALYDQGLLNKEIAVQLGCNRNWVTKLLNHWFTSRGLPMVDGRKRRSSLPRKQTGETLYEQLADQAKQLWDEGLADLQIAARLACSPPTASAAVAYWFRSRGQEPPTHAERRNALIDRMKEFYDQGKSIREIAKGVGMCTRSVTLLLRERFASEGKVMPDGRTRRRTRDKDHD